jgi:hypothetical protein
MKPTSFKWLINSFAISVSLVSVEAVPSVFAQTCYTDSRGNIVDLGGLCRTTEDRTTPTLPTSAPQAGRRDSSTEFVRNVASTPFPGWLFDSDQNNEKAYLTRQMRDGESTLFIYQNRFIQDFSQWPYTASATNHAEWSYLDCQTGWRGLDSHPMVGTSDPFFIPPSRMDGSVADAYRSKCNRAGLQHGF